MSCKSITSAFLCKTICSCCRWCKNDQSVSGISDYNRGELANQPIAEPPCFAQMFSSALMLYPEQSPFTHTKHQLLLMPCLQDKVPTILVHLTDRFGRRIHTQKHTLTSLTGAGPVSSASAVTYESIPAFFTDTSVFARVALTLLARLLVAGGFDASAILCLSNLTDVLASTINEKVTDAAHVAIVEHGCPELGGQDEVGAVSGEPTQVHVSLQVQNFTFTTSCKWSPSAVYRDGACSGDGERADQTQACTVTTQNGDERRKTCCFYTDGSDALSLNLNQTQVYVF